MAEVWLCTERRGGGGTAVWLSKDETLRSSIVSPYLGMDQIWQSTIIRRHLAQHGQIMRMFSQANRDNRLRESPHKTMLLWSFCCRKPEWMDLSVHFVWWWVFFFPVGCLCVCQCWQAQFHSRPWLDFVPKLLLESIKTLHCRTYQPRPSVDISGLLWDIEKKTQVGFLGEGKKYVLYKKMKVLICIGKKRTVALKCVVSA